MQALIANTEFRHLPLAVLVVYVPFHLLEEALGDFPAWLTEMYHLPVILSYPHWLLNNLAFIIVLTSGYCLYRKRPETHLALGVGLLIWAFMNGAEHLFGSIISRQLSPGSFSSVVFILIAILGFTRLKLAGVLHSRLIYWSLAAGVGYWIIPFGIILLMGNTLLAAFPSGR